MQGQAAHFVNFAPEKIEYGIRRYTNETRRLYGVIEKALADGRQWLAAGEYTIADMANFSWMYVHHMAGETAQTQHSTVTADGHAAVCAIDNYLCSASELLSAGYLSCVTARLWQRLTENACLQSALQCSMGLTL